MKALLMRSCEKWKSVGFMSYFNSMVSCPITSGTGGVLGEVSLRLYVKKADFTVLLEYVSETFYIFV